MGLCVANIRRSCHGPCYCPLLCWRVRPITVCSIWGRDKNSRWKVLHQSSSPCCPRLPFLHLYTNSSLLSRMVGRNIPYIFPLVLGIHTSLMCLLFLQVWSWEKESVAWAGQPFGQGSPLSVLNFKLLPQRVVDVRYFISVSRIKINIWKILSSFLLSKDLNPKLLFSRREEYADMPTG